MRAALLFAFLVLKSTTAFSQVLKPDSEGVYTLSVHHSECTDCADFEIENGAIQVPDRFWQSYFQYKKTHTKSSQNIGLSERTRVNYRVTDLMLENDSIFNSLFLLPGRTLNDTIRNNVGNIYPWDFTRHYRITGSIIGFREGYLIFRLRKATLLK